MVRSASRSTTELVGEGREIAKRNTTAFYEYIEGRYGRKNQNPVKHSKSYLLSPGYITWEGSGIFSVYTTISNSAVDSQGIYALVSHKFENVVDRILFGVNKSIQPINTSFSIANYLLELREVADLATVPKIINKRVKRVGRSTSLKFKRGKLNRSDLNEALSDMSDTTLSTSFGIVPTVQDSQELLSRLRGLESAYEEVKASLKPKSFRRRINVNIPPFSIPSVLRSQASIIEDGQLMDRVTITEAYVIASGRASYRAPYIESLGYSTAVYDKAGFHLDAATVWNAIPFSWAVDWFLPIGDYFESSRVPWTDVQIDVQGTLTRVLKGYISCPKADVSRCFHQGEQAKYSKAGKVSFSYYWREPLVYDSTWKTPPLNLKIGNWSGRKSAIAAAFAQKGISSRFPLKR